MKQLILVIALLFVSVACSDNATNTTSDLKGNWQFQEIVGQDTFSFTANIDEAAGLVSGTANVLYIKYSMQGSSTVREETKHSGTVTGSYISPKLTFNFTTGSNNLILFDGVYDKSSDRITGKCGYATDQLNQPLYYTVIMDRVPVQTSF